MGSSVAADPALVTANRFSCTARTPLLKTSDPKARSHAVHGAPIGRLGLQIQMGTPPSPILYFVLRGSVGVQAFHSATVFAVEVATLAARRRIGAIGDI